MLIFHKLAYTPSQIRLDLAFKGIETSLSVIAHTIIFTKFPNCNNAVKPKQGMLTRGKQIQNYASQYSRKNKHKSLRIASSWRESSASASFLQSGPGRPILRHPPSSSLRREHANGKDKAVILCLAPATFVHKPSNPKTHGLS